MKFLILDEFFKSIEKEKNYIKKFIISKIEYFIKEYEASKYNIKEMPNGLSIRKIEGAKQNIFKFKVNDADRILFTFGKHFPYIRQEYKYSIVFLDYCTHDNQIIRGKNINLCDEKILNVDLNQFQDDVDKYIFDRFKDFDLNLDKTITMIMDIDDMKNYIDEENHKISYYLNSEQYQVVNQNLNPLFLFGSAGSGKSIIGINKAFSLFCNNKIKIGYITYSKHLIDECIYYFKKLCFDNKVKVYQDENIFYLGEDKSIEFITINDYLVRCSDKSCFVSYEQFSNWFLNEFKLLKKIKDINLKTIDIWREIRGIIKGLLHIESIKMAMDKNKFDNETLNFLYYNNLAYLNDDELIINTDQLVRLQDKLSLNSYNDIAKDIEKIYQNLDYNIFEFKHISKNNYLNYPHKISPYKKDEKEIIYDVAKKYQVWLDKNLKFDDNDLTRLSLKNYYTKGFSDNIYDYIICDEVQDLTEMQVYFLIKCVKNKLNILLSGDFNQTINPTFFKTGRIEALFKLYTGSRSFNRIDLKNNYRNSIKIVNLANKLSNLRIKKIGFSKRNDYQEIAIRKENGNIFLLCGKNDALKDKIINIAINRHYVNIVVADDRQKQLIKSYIDKDVNIFTVQEIKGLENEYIIAINLVSSYDKKWSDILKNKKSSDKARYYFNLLYVTITRARNNLLLIEDNMSSGFYEYFKDEFEVVDYYDEKYLCLDKISTSNDFFKKALEFESEEKYENAIVEYRKVLDDEICSIYAKKGIKRCNALIKYKNGFYKDSASELMDIKEYEIASNIYLNLKDYKNYINALLKNDISYEDLNSKLKKININIYDLIIEHIYLDFEEEVMNKYKDYIKRQTSKLSLNIREIDKEIENCMNIMNDI